MEVNHHIDHTMLRPTAGRSAIKTLCEEAVAYGFFAVCVHPCYVGYARELLEGTSVKVATVIGFPMGMNTIEVKVAETMQALQTGADEIDMVINSAEFLSENYDYTLEEISRVKEVVGDNTLKVIIETSNLTPEQIACVSKIAVNGGADYVKTSTGYFGEGATESNVATIRRAVGNKCRIKASGGIRDYAFAKRLIDAGADRIGASAGVKIVEESNNE